MTERRAETGKNSIELPQATKDRITYDILHTDREQTVIADAHNVHRKTVRNYALHLGVDMASRFPHSGGAGVRKDTYNALVAALLDKPDSVFAELARTFGYSAARVGKIAESLGIEPRSFSIHTRTEHERVIALIRDGSWTAREIATKTGYTARGIWEIARKIGVVLHTHRHEVDNLPYTPRPSFFSSTPLPPLPTSFAPTAPDLPAWATVHPDALLTRPHPTTPFYARPTHGRR